jgi:predicted ATPase
LAAAPHVKLLITSRKRLNLREEWLLNIGGLSYPETGHSFGEDYSAIQLFMETVRRTQPGFSISVADQAAIIEICQLVEGTPLGIELASAWAGTLLPEELAREIRRSFDFLTSPIRNVPDRHRSLRALFDHSWELLPDPERKLLARLSVFQGKFTRAAAVFVADASLLLLKSLINNSLLRSSSAGLFEMHEIIRQYAAEKLQESSEIAHAVRARHARHYAAFLKQQEARLLKEQRQPIVEIAARIDNVAAAWYWAVNHDQLTEIRQSLISLYLFYYDQGWIQEGEAAFKQATERVKEMPSEDSQLVLGQLLSRRGHFAYRLGLHRQAKKLLEDSLAIFRRHANINPLLAQREIAHALYYLSATIRADGAYDQARRLCQESLALYQADTNPRGMARALKLPGIISGTVGDYENAQRHFQQALQQYQDINDQTGVANTLNDLGILADRRGQYTEAKQLHQQCLAIHRKSGNLRGIGTSLNNLGILAQDRGEYGAARDLLQESLGIQEEIGDQYHIANCLANLGTVHCALGNYDEARHNYVKGLKFAIEIGASPLALEILTGIATLMISTEPVQREWAAELFAFVDSQPGIETLTINKVQSGLAQLTTQLLPEVMISARSAAEATNLNMVVARVVGEMDRGSAFGSTEASPIEKGPS